MIGLRAQAGLLFVEADSEFTFSGDPNWLAGAKNPLPLNGSNIHPWLGIWKLSLVFQHDPNMKGSTTTVYREHRFRFKAGPLSLRKQPPVCSASREVFEHPM
jgi:hypothetical protein